ncbi:Mobile element protein [Microcystis panniformis FACHB-1757]|uniref:Mobile element protein n=1 Tax=Microcystis panniformis FACHB-1757 TaxID=1638788 RepID=A0A0K1SAL1_9CHRO|nr:Mobile element protein [Microcystis panniformis FACHB-1757]
MCDNFCLCKVKCLLGKTFRTILKEETISIDLVYTQKPEEPKNLSWKRSPYFKNAQKRRSGRDFGV